MNEKYADTRKNYEEYRRKNFKSITFRVTPEDKKLLEQKAKFCNLCEADYLRKIIRENVIIIENEQEKKDYLYELNKIGVNINQIARVVNENGNISDEQMQMVLEEMKNVKKIVQQYFERK